MNPTNDLVDELLDAVHAPTDDEGARIAAAVALLLLSKRPANGNGERRGPPASCFRARFAGSCRTCRAPIHIGDEVIWRRDVRGVQCLDCAGDARGAA